MVNDVQDLDAVFGALSDPTRRAILDRLLAGGEATVTEVAEPFGVSLPAVSKHLKVLERAGLLHRRVEGRLHWLSVDPEPLEGVADWISHYRKFWTDRLRALERFVVAKEARNRSQRSKST